MKKINTLFVLFAIALSLGLNAQDTVSYWGFEEGTTFGPMGSNWNNDGTTWSHEIIIDDENAAYAGSAYFMAEVESEPANSWDNQAVYQDIEIENETSYRFSMMIRADATDGFNPSVNLSCGSYNNWAEIQSKTNVSVNEDWRKLVLMLAVDDTEDLDLIDENGDYENTVRFPISYPIPGTYYVDDVTILKSTIAGIAFKGNTMVVDYGYALTYVESISAQAYEVLVNDQIVGVISANMESGGSNSKVYLNLENAISEGDVVLVAFFGDNELKYASYSPTTTDKIVAEFEEEAAVYDASIEPITIAIHEAKVNELQVNVYPNPVINTLNIDCMKNIAKIEVFNVAGQQILSNTPNTKEMSINIQDVSNGVYTIKITGNQGKSTTRKFIK